MRINISGCHDLLLARYLINVDQLSINAVRVRTKTHFYHLFTKAISFLKLSMLCDNNFIITNDLANEDVIILVRSFSLATGSRRYHLIIVTNVAVHLLMNGLLLNRVISVFGRVEFTD